MKRTKPTFKQKRFAKEYIRNNGNGTQAYLKTYDVKNPAYAAMRASNLIRNDNVKREINEILDRSGLNQEAISDRVKAILNREPEKVTDQGVLRAAEMLYKLHGAFPATKSARLNVNVTDRYKDIKYQDLIKELRRTRETTEKLLKDIEAK